MLLVIPSIEIAGGKCARNILCADGSLSPQDPVEMAVLWRKENAKTLHLVDRDGLRDGRLFNMETIRKMTATVDIPFEMGCNLNSFDEIKKMFDCGIYRVIIGPEMLNDPLETKRVLNSFGASKVAFGISMKNATSAATSLAAKAQTLGFKRIVYGDLELEEEVRHPDFGPTVKALTENTGMRVTIAGGVSSLEELLILQEAESSGVDSVIFGRALYENRFACQGLWRFCEAGDFPFTARV